MLPDYVNSSYSDLRLIVASMSGQYLDDTSAPAMARLDSACQRYLQARRHSAQIHILAQAPLGDGARQECDHDQPDPERITIKRPCDIAGRQSP